MLDIQTVRPVADESCCVPLNQTQASDREIAGAGNCTKCPCIAYEDSNAENDYCNCGHSYEDHW